MMRFRVVLDEKFWQIYLLPVSAYRVHTDVLSAGQTFTSLIMVMWTPTESSCGTDPETLNNTSSWIENVAFERSEIFLDLS